MEHGKTIQLRRDLTVDIGKAIAIILMCVGHSYVCTNLGHFIGLFHMAFFFMMSGYFFREKSLEHPKQFFWKRVKGLYIPFVKWGAAFVLLHNVFTAIGINSEKAGLYTLKEMAYRSATTITRFIPTEECMGPYWFLSCLFYVSLFSFGVFYVNRKLKNKTYTTFATFLFFYVAGFLLLHFSGESGWSGTCVRTFVVSFLFYLGYLLGTRFKDNVSFRNPIVTIASFSVLCVGTLWGGEISIPQCQFINPLLFLIFSLSGCFFVLGLSHFISQKEGMAKVMAFIGEHSLIILMMNMLLRRIYFLLLFKLEYPGMNFYDVNLQEMLPWWHSLGCTAFMVVVPMMIVLLKIKLKKIYLQVSL